MQISTSKGGGGGGIGELALMNLKPKQYNYNRVNCKS